MEYTETTVPGLGTGEKAYQVDTGEIVKVRIVRVPPPPKAVCVALKVDACIVDANGDPCEIAPGVPCICPTTGHTISEDALAAGQTRVGQEIQRTTERAIRRVLLHAEELRAAEAIPLDPDLSGA